MFVMRPSSGTLRKALSTELLPLSRRASEPRLPKPSKIELSVYTMTRMTLENIRDRGWNTKQLYLFWNFVCERHHIWNRRVLDGMSPPWTGDPILNQYFFTNVYRQLDKGTIYYFQQVIRGHEEDASLNDLIFNTLIYRLFNRIETFEYLGFTPHGKWHFSEKAQLLEKYQDTEQKVFTDAFTVKIGR